MDNRHVSSLPDATSGAERPRDYERRQKASRNDPAGRMDEEAAPRKSLLNTTAALLECIGEDPKREGLRNTPERHGKAWLNITRGYDQKLDDVVNDAIFKHDATDLVLVKDIEISSVCEHHLLPFTGKMHIGYIPNGQVIGLSKLARIAEMYAQRLQIQERLTAEVAKAVEKVLKPDGVVVVCECHHQCMSMRGVRQKSAATVTQCKLGQFKDPDRMALAEFHALLNGS